jgi:hypothetical protein
MPLAIDDFTTGAAGFSTPPAARVDRWQTGAMLGGARHIGLHNTFSPLNRPATLDIGGGDGLNLTLGAVQYARLEAGYGWDADGNASPLGVDLQSNGTGFRTVVNPQDPQFFVNFNIVVFAPDGKWSISGVNASTNTSTNTIDLPFTGFQGPAGNNFPDISFILYIFQTSDDLAITSFEIA